MNARLKKEIDDLRKKSADGRIRPGPMVEFARGNPDSELHGQFQWDDGECGRQYRLEQARNLIRAYVIVLPRLERRVRGYISLSTDRDQGGGYRQTERVIRNSSQRNQMIAEAFETARSFRRRYHYLPELDQFFDDVDQLVADWADKLEIDLPERAEAAEPAMAGR